MMNAGLVNLIVTTAVQAAVGAIIAQIIRRYAGQVDKIAERVRELEEKRIAKVERACEQNISEHKALAAAVDGRISREEQQAVLARIERVSDEQQKTAIQQTQTATEMRMAANQISDLFGKVAVLSRDVARMQGKIED